MSVKKDGTSRRYIGQKKVADALGISVQTVRRLIDRGELTAVSVAGHSIRVAEDDLERFLQARRIGRPLKPNTHPDRSEETL